ncbi:hypothetical protein HQ529_02660, partial [Candidatus Woesearchaeota archaeon]|nr:hypothetical protein [Candidatus Woesearchaeota archaeon]
MAFKLGVDYIKLMEEKGHYASEVFDWYKNLKHSTIKKRSAILSKIWNYNIKKNLERNDTLSEILEDETLTHELLLKFDGNNDLNSEPILRYIHSYIADTIELDKNKDLPYGLYSNFQYGSRLTSQQIAKNKNGVFSETEDITDQFTDAKFLSTINEFNRKLREELHRGSTV